MRDFICYFSDTDLSIYFYLKKVEERISKIVNQTEFSNINDIVELWHIKKIMESGRKLEEWTDEKYCQLKTATENYNLYILDYFKNNKSSIESEYGLLNLEYKSSFWKIIDSLKLYSLLDSETICKIVSEDFNTLYSILLCKGLVEKYKTTLREIFIGNIESAHILLDKYVAVQVGKEEVFIPSNLTIKDKEDIIVRYLDCDDPNLNYVRLITQVKDDKNNLMLAPKTRYKAAKLEKTLNKELLTNSNAGKVESLFCVQYVDDATIESVSVAQNNNEIVYTYSTEYIRKCDDVKLVFNCVSLFGWFNEHFMLNLISKKKEINTFEYVFIDKSRNSYPDYIWFVQKNKLANCQIHIYRSVLNELGKSFETTLKYFYETYLYDMYGYQGLAINMSSENETWLSKCRNLFPEIDNIAKQFGLYVEEGEIDEYLMSFGKPVKLQNFKSILLRKYYEVNSGNNEIRSVVNVLFSYNRIKYTNRQYESVCDLLEKESCVKYSNCEPSLFNILMKQEIITVDENDIVIFDKVMINVLKSIWEYEACSYWHHNIAERKILDEMKDKGWLVVSDNLFTRSEQDYLSYYLDNAKFTNGFAYRNLYSHGSNPHNNDPNHHKHIEAYNTFLIILTILILKIEDDLCLAKTIFIASECDKYYNKKRKDRNEF